MFMTPNSASLHESYLEVIESYLKMAILSIEQRVFIVKNYYQLNSSPTAVQREWNKMFTDRNPPTRANILR